MQTDIITKNRTEQNRTAITLQQTNVLKGIAILIVTVGHFYRYAFNASGIMHSVAFFGATLFAFLTGYGITLSYEAKGFGGKAIIWVIKRWLKVNIPFILVNIISVTFIYRGKNNIPVLNRILFGADDFVQWYIPFISLFYIVFVISCVLGKKHRVILFTILSAICLALGIVFIDVSNCYTSIGALVLGVYLAYNREKVNGVKRPGIIVIGNFILWILFSLISKKWDEIAIIKDVFTTLAGVVFSGACFFFIIFINKNEKLGIHWIDTILAFLGSISLWLYLTHMKVMLLFMKNPNHKVFLYVILSIFIAYVCSWIYGRVSNLFREKFIR